MNDLVNTSIYTVQHNKTYVIKDILENLLLRSYEYIKIQKSLTSITVYVSTNMYIYVFIYSDCIYAQR